MKYITVIGNIGSGKSTLVHLLRKKLHLDVLLADDLFQTKDPFRDKYLKDTKRWALANELWLTKERVQLVNKKRNKKGKNLLIDSGLIMSWVYTRSHNLKKTITDSEWELYVDLYNRLTKDLMTKTTIIYLDCSVKILLERIHNRGRDYELKYYNAQYLRHIQAGLNEFMRGRKKKDTLSISEIEGGDFENNRDCQDVVIKLVTEFINKK